jgi:hypothetical protein
MWGPAPEYEDFNQKIHPQKIVLTLILSRMNNLVKTLVLISVLFITGMTNTFAQITITVNWDLCSDTCFTLDECRYRADVVIYDKCGENQVEMCTGLESVECSEFEAQVDLDCSCLETSLEPCYLAVAYVNKLCIGQGGTITVCSGYGYGYFTCGELMSGNSSVDIEWQ